MVVVTLLTHTNILPSLPTKHHHLFLSSLDLNWRAFRYNQRLLFYKLGFSDHGSYYSALLHRLQSSLSQVLVYFYPWAGRLAAGDDGRFVIRCNDAGVEFVEARIDTRMSELEPDFQFKPFFKDLARLGDLCSSNGTDVPLLSVQVTQFLDGGIVLGISQSHVVADGHSLWHFLVSWGECARGISISKPPIHERTALAIDTPSPAKAGNQVEFDTKPAFTEPATSIEAERVFHFSHETLSRLRTATIENGSKAFSSFEAFISHCWKRVIRAQNLRPETKVQFLVLANCRHRLVPPLPDNYFGNVIIHQVVVSQAGEVLQESLGATAARFREAINRFNNQSVWELINWLELRDNKFEHIHFDGVAMNVASSPRFPVYEVDFGWGRPESVRPARVGGKGEVCLFADRDGRGGMDVCLKLGWEAMEVLQKDPFFCSPLEEKDPSSCSLPAATPL